MRVVVDIPPELVDEIRSIVREAEYDDPEEFLRRALRTQVQLERGEQQSLPSFGEAVSESKLGSSSDSGDSSMGDSGTENTRLPDLSARDFDLPTVAPPTADRIDTGPLWGQYNRIFPVKLSLRRLAIVLQQSDAERADYQTFRDETAEVARRYGLRLQELDEEKGRGRGEKFSAALPTGDKVEKSLSRYKTHFVGQIDSRGNLTGAPANLKFIDISPEEPRFGLTSAGLEFARIENPLLDDDITQSTSLSDSEKRFYLDHVTEQHQEENDAMNVVAEAIADGIDRPEPLSERIGELSSEWSDAQASTVRSGLIGRMHELGLVSRRRVGARGIGYELTENGRQELLE